MTFILFELSTVVMRIRWIVGATDKGEVIVPCECRSNHCIVSNFMRLRPLSKILCTYVSVHLAVMGSWEENVTYSAALMDTWYAICNYIVLFVIAVADQKYKNPPLFFTLPLPLLFITCLCCHETSNVSFSHRTNGRQLGKRNITLMTLNTVYQNPWQKSRFAMTYFTDK